jgi:hypothetical protein
MKIFNSIVIIAAAFLSGCATLSVNPSIKEEHFSSIERIGVVSFLDDTFHGIHIGTTIFNNKEYTQEIPEWKIGDKLVDFSVSHLSESTNYDVSGIDLTSEQRTSMLENGDSRNVKYNEVLSLCKEKGIDTVVIFRGVRYDNTPFHKTPYGFFQRKAIGVNYRNIYSLFVMEVYDVQLGKEIGWHWGYPNGAAETSIEWKPQFSEFSDDEKEIIKDRLIRHVEESARTALTKVFQKCAQPVAGGDGAR